jgi:CubicO group peptidase (beta-lactamase class C family)
LKNISFLLIVIISWCFFSCKSEQKSIYQEEIKSEIFDSVKINFKVLENDNRIKKINSFFQGKFTRNQFNGNILFAENGNIITQKSYGYSNFRKKELLTKEHSFQLASVSKPFTSIAILQLIEENKINLKDTIQKFFPDIPYPGITIHQLLSHRSGMSQYTHFCDAPDSIWPNKSVTINNQDVIEIISRIVPLINYKPNHKYYYCNTNYLLLASIVEQVSGLSFKQYVKKYIFNPSGMFSSTIYDRTNFEDLVLPAQGYENKTPWEDVYLNGVVGDKGVYSTTEDLLKFDRALKENVFISDSLKKLAFSKMNLDKNGNKNYGYGFRLKEHEKYGKIVYHTGWWKGFRSYFIKVMDKNQTIIVLNNVKRGRFLNIDRLIELISLKS